MTKELITNEEVKFTVNGKEFNGILSHPDSKAPYPAMVLLQGSDRSSAGDPYYAEHAGYLVRSGFAVLRYDGTGWGGGTSNDSGFETLEYRTEEAIAAVKYLQSRGDIKSGAVGLWGISQGGWICQMAAASYDGVAFIIPVSGPGVTPAEQEVYRVDAMSKSAGLEDDEIARAVLMRRLMVDAVLNTPMYQEVNEYESDRLGAGAWSEMAELVYGPRPNDVAVEYEKVVGILKRIKDEPWAEFLYPDQVLALLSNMPPQAWGMAKTQMRAVMEVNPARFLTKVHCPVLAIFGEKDTSIPVDKSLTLYKRCLGEAGNKGFTYRVFENASHTIRVGDKFADGYFDLMVAWLTDLAVG